MDNLGEGYTLELLSQIFPHTGDDASSAGLIFTEAAKVGELLKVTLEGEDVATRAACLLRASNVARA
eukprot:4722585-Pyramimonas_sp.AAC.1